jgi:hypothetical protein
MSDQTEQHGESVEFDLLVEQFLAGQISEADAARLQAMLAERPERGDNLLGQLRVDAMLREVASGDAEGVSAADRVLRMPSPVRSRTSRRTWWLGWGLAAAACAALAIILLRRPSAALPTNDPTRVAVQTQPAEATSAAVAVITGAADVTWADPAETHDIGAPLEPGKLRLKSGLVQIEFFSGARVVLEGPAELRLISSMEAYCPSGRLTAEVPTPARGFKIGTPRGDVVDLGTSFGLNVSETQAAVHVFKGQIELHHSAAATNTPRGVTEGHGIELQSNGRVRDITADAAGFADGAAIERRSQATRQARFAAWQAAAAKITADPSLLIRFDFADAGDLSAEHVVLNSATAGAVGRKAVVVGSGRAEGRWPGKPALEFRGVSDRVRLELPGEMPAISLAAWVWVNGLDRQYNSIFMADAFNAGAIHWQILNDGRVRLGVGSNGDYDSPVVFTPERYGRWVHLAVVYDRAGGKAIHYVNGRPVSSQALRFDIKPKIGGAELGNWNPAPRKDRTAVRHFSGRLDEFELFSRPLSDPEILDLFKAGESQPESGS